MPRRLKPKSAYKKALPTNLRLKIADNLHKIIHVATRPEFGKYGKNLKTADDVIAYYGHGLANLIGGKPKKRKPEDKKTFRYTSSSSPYSKILKKTPKKQDIKQLEAPKKQKLLPAPKPAKKTLSFKSVKALPAPKVTKLLPKPEKKMLTGPKPQKMLPPPKSTAVGRPLPIQKRLPSRGEKVIGSGSTIAARTQGMPTPKKALSAPQKQLPKLESIVGNRAIEAYKEKLYEYSMKQFGSDVSDTARGLAKGITFGASDNIEAGAKSLFKGTSYKSELGKAKQANATAQKRSPALYGAGEIAGAIAAPVPGAAAIRGISAATKIGKAAKVGAQIGSSIATQSAVDKVKSVAEPKIGTMVRPNKPQPAFKAPITK
jgi:hypothetical protein